MVSDKYHRVTRSGHNLATEKKETSLKLLLSLTTWLPSSSSHTELEKHFIIFCIFFLAFVFLEAKSSIRVYQNECLKNI